MQLTLTALIIETCLLRVRLITFVPLNLVCSFILDWGPRWWGCEFETHPCWCNQLQSQFTRIQFSYRGLMVFSGYSGFLYHQKLAANKKPKRGAQKWRVNNNNQQINNLGLEMCCILKSGHTYFDVCLWL